jgi:hypothetical protein
MLSKIITISIIRCAALFGLFFAANISSQTIDPQLSNPPDNCASLSVELLRDMDYTLFCSKDSNSRPFIAPFLAVDWGKYRSEVFRRCNRVIPAPDQTPLVAPTGLSIEEISKLKNEKIERFQVDITFQTKQVTDEIFSKVFRIPIFYKNKDFLTLSAYPYDYIVIRTGVAAGGGNNRIVYTYPKIDPTATDIFKRKSLTTHPYNPDPFFLSASCQEHARIVLEQDLDAELVFKYKEVQRNFTQITYSNFIASDAYRSIFLEQSKTGSVRTEQSGSAGGFGLNIGPVSIGGGGSNTKINLIDDRRRAVTGNVIDDAVRKFVSTVNVTTWTEWGGNDSGNSRSAAVSEIVKKILDNGVAAKLSVVTESQNIQTLLYEDVTIPLTPDDKETLYKITDPQKFDSKLKQEFDATVGGVKVGGSSDRTFNVPTLGSSVEYSSKGGTWIPTNINVKIVTRSDSADTGSIEWSEFAAKVGSGLSVLSLQKPSSRAKPRQFVQTPWQVDVIPLQLRSEHILPEDFAKMSSNNLSPDMPYCVSTDFINVVGHRMAVITTADYSGPVNNSNSTLLSQSSSARVHLLNPQVTWPILCPPFTERMQSCVTKASLCFNKSLSRACAVNDEYLNYYNTNVPNLHKNIESLCTPVVN